MIAITQRQLTLLAGTVLLLGSALSARADYNFNFNSLTPSLTQSDQSTAIANYMDSVLGGTCATMLNCVTVSGLNSGGTAGGGVAVDQKYTGDGFVVGNVSGSPAVVTPVTLGNTDNAATNNAGTKAYDSFISNTADPEGSNGPAQLSQGILITFKNGVSLTGTFTFDYEIFPDGTCPSLSNCGGTGNPNLPDLDFSATGGTTSASHTYYGVAPSTLSDGSSTHSVSSGTGGTETAPQYIGVSQAFTLTGATSLSFMDWPATIGVDNLKLVTTTPEPRGDVFLLGMLAFVALAGSRLRRARAKS
jgi:hypothetical protein